MQPTDRLEDSHCVTAGEAFEQQGAAADANGQAWMMVVMGGTQTEPLPGGPSAAEPPAQPFTLDLEVRWWGHDARFLHGRGICGCRQRVTSSGSFA